MHGDLPEEALVINLLVLRLIVKQAQNRDNAQRPEDETDYAVKPTDPHVLRQVVFFQARLHGSKHTQLTRAW
jgi:hypothetical protein